MNYFEQWNMISVIVLVVNTIGFGIILYNIINVIRGNNESTLD